MVPYIYEYTHIWYHMLKPKQDEQKKKYPILDLDVLVEKNSWWVVWEYIFSGKLRQPEDLDKS